MTRRSLLLRDKPDTLASDISSIDRALKLFGFAVAESFFHLLKTKRIRRKTYKTRIEARQDVFDYIELVYNLVRRPANNGMLSPVEIEMAAK